MIYQKLPIIFLSTVANDKQDSINSHIASYIISHLDTLQDVGIKDLAIQCNVSISQISRFVREIGLKDFQELKQMIDEASLTYENSITSRSIKKRSKAYATQVKESMDQVIRSIDLDMIHTLCLDMQRYEKVAVFGLLKAESAAISLQCDLFMQHKIIYTNSNYAEQMDYIMHASRDTLIILLSYTGSYFESVDLRGKKDRLSLPKIYMITGNQEVPDFIHHVIAFDSNGDQLSHPYSLQLIAGLIAQEYANILEKKEV